MPAAVRACCMHDDDVHTTDRAVGVITARGTIICADRVCAREKVDPDLIVGVELCTDLQMARS